jgi:hypothetical protein
MAQICKQCRRANPREAAYCYHDGAALEGHAGADVPGDGSAIDRAGRPFPGRVALGGYPPAAPTDPYVQG